jgi:glucokinase
MTQILAIDIGGTNTKLAPVNLDGKTFSVKTIPTSGEAGPGAFLELIASTAQTIIEKKESDPICGIGLGIAGFIDACHTTMTFNPNIGWMQGINLCHYFEDRFHLPVTLEVDSNAAALAEAVIGNGKEYGRLLVLTIGTGLGGGMVVNGKVLRISNECLGDIGHVMVEPGGIECSSGCKGCAEAYVSATALERYAAQLSTERNEFQGNIMRTPEIIAAAGQGNEAARKAIQKLGSYLGLALASMAPILNPDCICIAGGVSEAGSGLIESATSSFRVHTGPPYSMHVVIKKALSGWQSVLIGAAISHRIYQNAAAGNK